MNFCFSLFKKSQKTIFFIKVIRLLNLKQFKKNIILNGYIFIKKYLHVMVPFNTSFKMKNKFNKDSRVKIASNHIKILLVIFENVFIVVPASQPVYWELFRIAKPYNCIKNNKNKIILSIYFSAILYLIIPSTNKILIVNV